MWILTVTTRTLPFNSEIPKFLLMILMCIPMIPIMYHETAP